MVPDKITVIRGPNSTYYVEPGSVININIVATTDPMWTNQMNYTWNWYEKVEDENTGDTTTGRSSFSKCRNFCFEVV